MAGGTYRWLSRSELHVGKNGFGEAPEPMHGCLGSHRSLYYRTCLKRLCQAHGSHGMSRAAGSGSFKGLCTWRIHLSKPSGKSPGPCLGPGGSLCCHQQSGEQPPGPAQPVWLLLTSRISIPEELKKDDKSPNYGFCGHFLPQAQATWHAAEKLPRCQVPGEGTPAGTEHRPHSQQGPQTPPQPSDL